MKKKKPVKEGPKYLSKTFKSFWPLFIIFIMGVIVGGTIIAAVNNSRLQDDIDSMVIIPHAELTKAANGQDTLDLNKTQSKAKTSTVNPQ